jgi:hypothetical protein
MAGKPIHDVGIHRYGYRLRGGMMEASGNGVTEVRESWGQVSHCTHPHTIHLNRANQNIAEEHKPGGNRGVSPTRNAAVQVARPDTSLT